VTTGRPYSEDVAYFVATSPYLQLSKRAKAEPFLSRAVEAAEECRSTFAAYPRVQIEALEFFYTCLRSLGTLDLPFIEGLLSQHNWRGAVWGAWLAILEPAPHFLPAVSEARGRWPHNDWLVECAFSAIRGSSPSPEHETILQLAARCREILRDVPRPAIQLRRAPTEAEVAQMIRSVGWSPLNTETLDKRRCSEIEMTFIDYLTRLEGLYRRRQITLSRREAASVAELQALERKIGQALPRDLRAAWRATDGIGNQQTVFARPGRLTGYEFLSVAGALEAREGLRERAPTYAGYREPQTRDQRIRAGWFHQGWLPFAEFGGGTLLLIVDLVPSGTGKSGQIIAFTHDPDEIEHIAPSFANLLENSMKAIEADSEELLGQP